MKRRSFLRSGSLSGISVLLFSAEKAFSFSKNAISSSKPADSYEELTISQIQVLLEAKTLSSVELVKILPSAHQGRRRNTSRAE